MRLLLWATGTPSALPRWESVESFLRNNDVSILFGFTAALSSFLFLRRRATAIECGAEGLSPGRLFVGTTEDTPNARHAAVERVIDGMRSTYGLRVPSIGGDGADAARGAEGGACFDWQFRPAYRLLTVLASLLPPDFSRNSGHVSTLGGAVRSAPLSVAFDRQHLELCDGAVVGLDWLRLSLPLEHAKMPILLVLHGICGGSTELYVQHIMTRGAEAGFRPVCFNFRGANDTMLAHPYAYSAGQTHDLRDVVRAVHQAYSEAPITLVGYSLGANVLTKFLGEEGGLFARSCSHVSPVVAMGSSGHEDCHEEGDVSYRAFLAGAVVVSNLFDLNCCSDFLHSRASGMVYSRHIARGLHKFVRRHYHVLDTLRHEDTSATGDKPVTPLRQDGGPSDSRSEALEAIQKLHKTGHYDPALVLREGTTIRRFDELVTAHSFGFDSVDHYYSSCSSSKFLSHVKVPLLCVSALDDPLVAEAGIPVHQMRELPWGGTRQGKRFQRNRIPPVSHLGSAIPANLRVSEYVALALTFTGGHVASLERKWPWESKEESFQDRVAVSFLDSALRKWSAPAAGEENGEHKTTAEI